MGVDINPLTGAATPPGNVTGANYTSSVLIEELDSVQRKVLASVELRGPGLPLMGADWASELNMDTTWYPGNPDEATQQVLGRRELPSAWSGTWSITQMSRVPSVFRLGDSSAVQVTSPQFLRDTLDEMFGRGRRLRVSWIVDSDNRALAGRVVREGRTKSWKFPHKRMVDIDWNVEFHWVSRGATLRKVSTRDDNLPSAQAALSAAIDLTIAAAEGTALYNASKTARRSASTFTLGQLEALADAPRKAAEKLAHDLRRATSSLQQVVGIADKIRNLPFAVANAAVGVARTVVETVNQDADLFSRTPVEQLSLRATVADTLRAASHFAQAQDAAALAARRASELDAKMRAQLSANPGGGAVSVRSTSASRPGDLVAVHVCVAGDTPDSISLRYYGSPDQAIALLRANRLPWHQVELRPGTVLVVPVVSSSQGA